MAIKKILPFSVNKLGLVQILEFNGVCNIWDEILGDFFGADYLKKSKPAALKNGILVVDCLNSVWSAELQLKQTKIIEEINKRLNKNLIEKIKFIA